MSLRLVEVHRSADGGWELVRGGLKPACAAAAAAATPATGALPAPPPDPGQPPHFRPLADLFAECLQQDSQLNAAFAVAHADTEPLSPAGVVCAPLDISPPAAIPAAAGAAVLPPSGPAARQPAPMLSPGAAAVGQLVAAAAAAPTMAQAPLGGTETQEDFPLSSQLQQASPPPPPAHHQQQQQQQQQGEQPDQQDQQVPATPNSQQQPGSLAEGMGQGGGPDHLELQLVAATEDQEPPAALPSAAALPADGSHQPAVARPPTVPQPDASEAETPLLSPQQTGGQAAVATPPHSQHAAVAGLQPQQLRFAPETAADVLPPHPQQRSGQLRFVPETAADVLLPQPAHQPQQGRQPFVPETAADVLPPQHPHAVCVPETAVDALQLHRLQFVPDTVADELPEAMAAPAGQEAAASRLPDFLPPTAMDMPAGMLVGAAAVAPGNLLPAAQAGAAAAVPAGAAAAAAAATAGRPPRPPRPMAIVEATAADELAALQGGGMPGCVLQLAAAPAPASGAGAQVLHMVPETAAPDLACPPAAATTAACPAVPLAAHALPALPPQQQPGCFGGLGDFDVVIEAPAGAPAEQQDPLASGGFDYDLSQPSPSPERRPPAPASVPWGRPGPAPQARAVHPQAQQPGWAGGPQQYQQRQAAGNMPPQQQRWAGQPPSSHYQQQQMRPPPHQHVAQHGPPAGPPYYQQPPQQQGGPWGRQQQQAQHQPPAGMQPQFHQQRCQQAGAQQQALAPQPQQPTHLPPRPGHSAAAAPTGPASTAVHQPPRAPSSNSAATQPQQQPLQQQLVQQPVQQAEQPRKRVSLLDRDPGSFKPVRPAGAGGCSGSIAYRPAAATRSTAGSSAAGKPAAAETAEEKRARVAGLQALLAQDMGYEGDLQAIPAGFGASFGRAGPAGTSVSARPSSAGSSAAPGEDAEARKARVMAEMTDLVGGGRGGSNGGRGRRGSMTGRGSMPGRGGPGGCPHPSHFQQQQQQQQAGTPQQQWQQPIPRQPPRWQGPPQQQQQQQPQQWQGPPQQWQQPASHQAQPQWHAPQPPVQSMQAAQPAAMPSPNHPADEGDVMADVAPGAFVTARSKRVWQTGGGRGGGGQQAARLAALMRDLQGSPEPEQPQAQPEQPAAALQAQQEQRPLLPPHLPGQQPPGQQAEQHAAAQPDEGDVMGDVQPGMFVTAGGKQSWRTGGGGGGPGSAKLAALMRELAGSEDEPPAAGEAGAPQQQQQQQPQVPQQQALTPSAPQAAAQPQLLVQGSLVDFSEEPFSPETAAQIAAMEAAALTERQHGQQAQQAQQGEAARLVAEAQQAQQEPQSGGAAQEAEQPAAPGSGSKRPREEGLAAAAEAGVLAKQARMEPQKQQQQQPQQQPQQQQDGPPQGGGGLVLMTGRMQEMAAMPEAQLREAAARLGAGSGSFGGSSDGSPEEEAAEEAEAPDQLPASAAPAEPAAAAEAAGAADAGAAVPQPALQDSHAAGSALPPGPMAGLCFTTGRGAAMSAGDPAKLAAMARMFGDDGGSFGGGGGGGGSSSEPEPGSEEQGQPAAPAALPATVALPLEFSTGRGGRVDVKAANLAAAQRQYGGPENGGGNGEEPAGGESTPLLRRQLLRTRPSLGAAASPAAAEGAAAAAAAAGEVGGETPAAALPAAPAPGGTTPVSAPVLGRARGAGPSRFGPGGATTGQLKRVGARKPLTPPVASGSGRKFKAPGKAAGTPGASRLGGGGQAAVVHKPAVQLHDLQGSLLKRLLAGWPVAGAAAAADDVAAPEQSAGAEAAAAIDVDGAQQPREQAEQQAQQLPLDSTACAAYCVPDQSLPAAPAASCEAGPAGTSGVPAGGQAQPAADQAVTGAGQQPPAALLGWEELRQRLLDAGANPAYASAAWARNHYRWVVWKLARLQLLLSTSASTSPSAGPAPQLLTAAVVLDELRLRYEREFNRGHRPLLKSVLQHDEVPSAAMVLMVASVHLPPPGSAAAAPAQQQPPQGRTPGGGNSGGSDYVGATLELIDGWYWVQASCDERLTQLARRGRICQGTKLRICGADLASPGPGEPLEAAGSAVLNLHANNTHPAPRDARLGRQRRRSVFVPLSRVAEGSGSVPQTVVVVQRVFTRLVYVGYADGSSTMLTPRQHEARMRGNEDFEARLAAEVAAEVQRREVERCRQWLARGKPGGLSHVERLYATATVQGGEGGGGGEDGLLASLNAHDTHDLQRYMEGRAAQLQRQQQELAEQRRAGGGGGLPTRQQDLLVLQVSEVCHASLIDCRPGGRERWQPRVAHISIWGGADASRELAEGAVYKVTHLAPDAKSKRTSGCLELKTTKRSHWEQIAASTDSLPPELLARFKPRAHLGIGQLGPACFGTSMDYTGLLLGASRCGNDANWTSFQWLMFADPTMMQLQQQQQQQQQQQRWPALQLASAAQPQGGSDAAEQAGGAAAGAAAEAPEAVATAPAPAPAGAVAAGPVPMEEDGEEAAATEAIAALLSETVAAVEAAVGDEGETDPASQQQEQQGQAVDVRPQNEQVAEVLLPTQLQLPLLPPTEVQCPDWPEGALPAAAEPAPIAAQRSPARQQAAAAPVQQLPPWLLAVKVTARPGQFDWLGPDDAGSIFTIKDVRLTQADRAERVWQATADERCAVQRHKPVLQAAGRGRHTGMAPPAAARGGPGAEVAAGVAAWASANPDLVARLRQRVAELMSR